MQEYIVVYVDAFNRLKVKGAANVNEIMKIVQNLTDPNSDHYIPIERIHISRLMGGAKEFLQSYERHGGQ